MPEQVCEVFSLTVWQLNGFLILLSNQVSNFEINPEIRYSTVNLCKRKQGHRHPNEGHFVKLQTF
jgi:hypothetical protein